MAEKRNVQQQQQYEGQDAFEERVIEIARVGEGCERWASVPLPRDRRGGR